MVLKNCNRNILTRLLKFRVHSVLREKLITNDINGQNNCIMATTIADTRDIIKINCYDVLVVAISYLSVKCVSLLNYVFEKLHESFVILRCCKGRQWHSQLLIMLRVFTYESVSNDLVHCAVIWVLGMLLKYERERPCSASRLRVCLVFIVTTVTIIYLFLST